MNGLKKMRNASADCIPHTQVEKPVKLTPREQLPTVQELELPAVPGLQLSFRISC
jgi:hypothetical protein